MVNTADTANTTKLYKCNVNYITYSDVVSWLLGATPAFKPAASSTSSAGSPGGPIESTFDVIRGVINEDVVKSTQGIYQFDLSGNHMIVFTSI